MSADPKAPDRFSLSRWSRRKHEAARETAASEPRSPAPVPTAPADPLPVTTPPAAAAGTASAADPPALPPLESLTPESDFAAFMQPKVDETLKRQALKKLFSDPRFNAMDGLDVYIDDYSKTVPIPPSVLERLAKMGFVRGLGAPADEPPAPAEALPIAERVPALPDAGESRPVMPVENVAEDAPTAEAPLPDRGAAEPPPRR